MHDLSELLGAVVARLVLQHTGQAKIATRGGIRRCHRIPAGAAAARVVQRREATRDGAPPIELVDGEKLLDMCEELELGLKPRKTFDVDPALFLELD